VASLHLAIMPGGIWLYQFMSDPFLIQNSLKQTKVSVLPGLEKTFGKFKSVVRLHTFNPDALSGKGSRFNEYSRREGVRCLKSFQISQTAEFINSCILVVSQKASVVFCFRFFSPFAIYN
jgi:hypothetical protein